jgi:hypothetical protein
MLIAPLSREPGRVVSTGRALVPTQPNFNDLFNDILKAKYEIPHWKRSADYRLQITGYQKETVKSGTRRITPKNLLFQW